MIKVKLKFIAPLFSTGAYSDRPEVRPASIRGQLHWWFRAVGGDFASEREIFGGVGKGAKASKVIVRTSDISGSVAKIATLPHKTGGYASPRTAYSEGSQATVHIIERLGGLNEAQRTTFLKAVEGWLLMGTLGYRSTRAGGSFWWSPIDESPIELCDTFDKYQQRCTEVLRNSRFKFALSSEAFEHSEDARYVISDTIGGKDDRKGQNNLKLIREPLGYIGKGRKTSPLRFRIVFLENAYHILALWDDRSEVTGNQPGDLPAVLKMLSESGKQIGDLFKDLTFT